MGLTKCPRCELNYIRSDENLCDVCRRQMRGEKDEAEELLNICQECGENKALSGQDLCAYCLGEKRRREKLESLKEQPAELLVDMTQLDEIDVPANNDIPSEDLQEISKEFGDEDEEEELSADENELEEDEFDELEFDGCDYDDEDDLLFGEDEEDPDDDEDEY